MQTNDAVRRNIAVLVPGQQIARVIGLTGGPRPPAIGVLQIVRAGLQRAVGPSAKRAGACGTFVIGAFTFLLST